MVKSEIHTTIFLRKLADKGSTRKPPQAASMREHDDRFIIHLKQ
jgi:hypothetical protein